MSNKKVLVMVFNLFFIILIRDVNFRSIALQFNIVMIFAYIIIRSIKVTCNKTNVIYK